MELVCSHTFWPLRRKGVSSATFTAALYIRTLPSAITAPAITSAAACCYSAKRRREWLFLILVYSHRVWHGVNSMRALHVCRAHSALMVGACLHESVFVSKHVDVDAPWHRRPGLVRRATRLLVFSWPFFSCHHSLCLPGLQPVRLTTTPAASQRWQWQPVRQRQEVAKCRHATHKIVHQQNIWQHA